MQCGDCIYWEENICYKKGTRVSHNNNICEDYIKEYIDRKGLKMDLMK